MLYQVESMFDDMEKKMRRLKKQKYEENMENFMAANEAYFLEMEVYCRGVCGSCKEPI